MTGWQLVALGAIGGAALTVFVGLMALVWRCGMQEEETDASGN